MRLFLSCACVSAMLISLTSCQEKTSNKDSKQFRDQALKDLLKPDSTTVSIRSRYHVGQDTILDIIRTFARAHDKPYYLRLSLDSISSVVLRNTILKTAINDSDSKSWSKRLKSLDTLRESRLSTQNKLAVKYGKNTGEIQDIITDYRVSYEKEFPLSDE